MITGTCKTGQAKQESRLTGDMIDTELEMLTAILLQTIDAAAVERFRLANSEAS
jgi:hypothetical protein